jgi:hypothetical protein
MSNDKWIYIDGIPAQFVSDAIRTKIIIFFFKRVVKKRMIAQLTSLLRSMQEEQLITFIEKVMEEK